MTLNKISKRCEKVVNNYTGGSMSERMDTNTIIDRIKFLLKVRDDKELADMLSISNTTISHWRNRGNLDAALIIKRFPTLDLNYVFKPEVAEPQVVYSTKDILEKMGNDIAELKQIIMHKAV